MVMGLKEDGELDLAFPWHWENILLTGRTCGERLLGLYNLHMEGFNPNAGEAVCSFEDVTVP